MSPSPDKTDLIFTRILGPSLQSATLRLGLLFLALAAVVATVSLAFAP
jgi:hypothetical protein